MIELINEFKEVIVQKWFNKDYVFEEGKIYISTGADYIFFKCPCGCGEIERIKQDSRTQIPNVKWKFTISDGTVTIHPSMYMRECKTNSHYWLRDSKVIWV